MQYFVETWFIGGFSLNPAPTWSVWQFKAPFCSPTKLLAIDGRGKGPALQRHKLWFITCAMWSGKESLKCDWWCFLPSDTLLECNFSFRQPKGTKRSGELLACCRCADDDDGCCCFCCCWRRKGKKKKRKTLYQIKFPLQTFNFSRSRWRWVVSPLMAPSSEFALFIIFSGLSATRKRIPRALLALRQ